jgi:hypothetical protein
MELQLNQIVQNQRGDIGYVAGFNNKPVVVMFQAFPMTVSRFNENLENKNPNYSIIKIWDGSTLENETDIYKKKFDLSTLPVVWEKTM